jgi:hypothetical protein
MQCVHCGAHWVVEHYSGRVRGWCTTCKGPTCGKKLCCKFCYPTEKQMDDLNAGKFRYGEGVLGPAKPVETEAVGPRILVP